MQIREATEGDIPDIARIERECFSDAWSEQALLSHLGADTSGTLVAVKDGTVCGCLLVGGVLPECEIYRVSTSPAFRRQGIARALIEHLFRTMQSDTVYFLEVRESNIPAIGLYESVGFARSGVRKNYYKLPSENAILMNKIQVR